MFIIQKNPFFLKFKPILKLFMYDYDLNQIEALKAIGVTEVVLAINYQPEVKFETLLLYY